MHKLHPFLIFGAGVVVTLVILAMLGVFGSSGVGPQTAEAKRSHYAMPVTGSTQITCSYPQILSARYMDGEVSHALPAEEGEPMIFTFSDLGQDIATLRYIDATRTISETPILKLYEDDQKLVFMDGDGSGYITTHTIFKSSGVAAYTKEVDLLGIPVGSLAMGTCVGY